MSIYYSRPCSWLIPQAKKCLSFEFRSKRVARKIEKIQKWLKMLLPKIEVSDDII